MEPFYRRAIRNLIFDIVVYTAMMVGMMLITWKNLENGELSWAIFMAAVAILDVTVIWSTVVKLRRKIRTNRWARKVARQMWIERQRQSQDNANR